jgi:hypothetical protein
MNPETKKERKRREREEQREAERAALLTRPCWRSFRRSISTL